MQADRRVRQFGRELRSLLLGVAAFLLASCVIPHTGERRPTAVFSPKGAEQARRTHVVIVTLDGARGHELFGGADAELAARHGLKPEERLSARELAPNLWALVEGGAVVLGAPGAPMRASGPNFVSLPGYAEIMTGRGPSCCRDNDCRWVSEPTLIDDLALAHGGDGSLAAVVSSWPDIGRVVAMDARGAAISTGRNGGVNLERFRATPALAAELERARRLDPYPGLGDFRPDRETGELGVAYFERWQPSFLFVGLGESDEYAHRGDYRGYLRAISEGDRTIGALWRALGHVARLGDRTALFVTVDHGRARSFRDHGSGYPESAAVWLVAAGTEIQGSGAPQAGKLRRLADIAPTVRLLFGLEPRLSERSGEVLSELLEPASERVSFLQTGRHVER